MPTEEEETAGLEEETVTDEATVDAMPSPEELKTLKEEAAKSREYWERLLRLTADLENYKKRAVRERQETVRYANEALLEQLLPVVDNFEAALTAARNAESTNLESLRTGVEMILTQIKNLLRENGLEEIEADGKPFDPNLHEAMAQEATDEVPEEHVLRQVRKGYKLRERLVRAASVVVARKPEGSETSDQ